jgi:hypothetical protein
LAEGRTPKTRGSVLAESLPLAVDAAAVSLPIHPPFLGYPDPFLPALTEIVVEERNAVFYGKRFGDPHNHVMLLISAVEERRRQGVHPLFPGHGKRDSQPFLITVPAPVLLLERHAPEIPFEGLTVPDDKIQGLLPGVGLQRFPPLPVFCIRMDVGVVEQPQDIAAGGPKNLQGINRAGTATDVEQYFHVFRNTAFERT